MEGTLVENRGRDIGPLMTAFEELWTDYDIVAHLHSKKSPHIESAAPGSNTCSDQTFGSPDLVDNILTFLAENPNVGILFIRKTTAG